MTVLLSDILTRWKETKLYNKSINQEGLESKGLPFYSLDSLGSLIL